MLKRFFSLLIPASLFLLVLGAKLDVLHRYGSDLPRWDQLDAEGLALFVPLARGELRFTDLFRPHNEHRIFWTKLLGLAELKLNGQWDARLQCTVNAVLHSALAVWVFLFARRGLDRRLHPAVFALVALFFALPLAWENPLAGFHSQQYFLLLFSFGAIALLPAAAPWSACWWVGAACTLAALGSMGSGLFAAAIVLGVLGLQARAAHDPRAMLRRAAPTLAVCGIALALGALGRVSVDYHEALKAGSAADFLLYALHCFGWPAGQPWSWLAAVFWSPALALAWRLARRRDGPVEAFPWIVLGLCAWVALQILATAYTRGAGGGMPSSRYADTFAFGLVANGLALAWLWPHFARPASRVAVPAGWIAAVLVSVASLARDIFQHPLPDNRRYLDACVENVRCYLATEDASHLREPDIPYPGIRSLRERLDQPALRAIMPASVRVPLAVAAQAPGPFRSHNTVRPARRHTPPPPPWPEAMAGLPEPANRVVWHSDPALGAGEFRSQPLRVATGTVLRFIVAGRGAVGLAAVDAATGAPLDEAELGGIRPDGWRSAYLRVPRGEIVLLARTGGAGAWLAFGEPAEMALGSHACDQLVRRGRWLWPAASLAAVLAWMGAIYCARNGKTLW